MTEEELDAAVDVIAAVDAGVLQSLNQRVKASAVGPQGAEPQARHPLHAAIIKAASPSVMRSSH